MFTVEPKDGVLAPVQNVSLLPNEHDSGFSKAAEIVITKDGSTVIASNRGVSGVQDPANTLFVYRVDPTTGHLTEAGENSLATENLLEEHCWAASSALPHSSRESAQGRRGSEAIHQRPLGAAACYAVSSAGLTYYPRLVTSSHTQIQREPSGTRYPRGIALSNSDKTLVVASQGTSRLTTFALQKDGTLAPSRPAVDVKKDVPNPTTAAFVVVG